MLLGEPPIVTVGRVTLDVSYCAYILTAPPDSVHRPYHDKEYGFPITPERFGERACESLLFERLMLEVNQAGLSWELILKRKDGFAEAFEGWDVEKVASYGEEDRARLLQDARIIRNRLKVEAAIHNANVILSLRDSHGGFHAWLQAHHPLTKTDWTKLFKKTFRFTGGEIVNEFLMSAGYLPGAHVEECPVLAEIATLAPPWMA